VLFVPRIRMLLIGPVLLVRASATASSTALGPPSAPHGPLESGARLIRNASRGRRLSLGTRKVFAGCKGVIVLSFLLCSLDFFVSFFALSFFLVS